MLILTSERKEQEDEDADDEEEDGMCETRTVGRSDRNTIVYITTTRRVLRFDQF